MSGEGTPGGNPAIRHDEPRFAPRESPPDAQTTTQGYRPDEAPREVYPGAHPDETGYHPQPSEYLPGIETTQATATNPVEPEYDLRTEVGYRHQQESPGGAPLAGPADQWHGQEDPDYYSVEPDREWHGQEDPDYYSVESDREWHGQEDPDYYSVQSPPEWHRQDLEDPDYYSVGSPLEWDGKELGDTDYYSVMSSSEGSGETPREGYRSGEGSKLVSLSEETEEKYPGYSPGDPDYYPQSGNAEYYPEEGLKQGAPEARPGEYEYLPGEERAWSVAHPGEIIPKIPIAPPLDASRPKGIYPDECQPALSPAKRPTEGTLMTRPGEAGYQTRSREEGWHGVNPGDELGEAPPNKPSEAPSGESKYCPLECPTGSLQCPRLSETCPVAALRPAKPEPRRKHGRRGRRFGSRAGKKTSYRPGEGIDFGLRCPRLGEPGYPGERLFAIKPWEIGYLPHEGPLDVKVVIRDDQRYRQKEESKPRVPEYMSPLPYEPVSSTVQDRSSGGSDAVPEDRGFGPWRGEQNYTSGEVPTDGVPNAVPGKQEDSVAQGSSEVEQVALPGTSGSPGVSEFPGDREMPGARGYRSRSGKTGYRLGEAALVGVLGASLGEPPKRIEDGLPGGPVGTRPSEPGYKSELGELNNFLPDGSLLVNSGDPGYQPKEDPSRAMSSEPISRPIEEPPEGLLWPVFDEPDKQPISDEIGGIPDARSREPGYESGVRPSHGSDSDSDEPYGPILNEEYLSILGSYDGVPGELGFLPTEFEPVSRSIEETVDEEPAKSGESRPRTGEQVRRPREGPSVGVPDSQPGDHRYPTRLIEEGYRLGEESRVVTRPRYRL